VTIVQFHRSSWDSGTPSEPGGLVGPGYIRVTGDLPFARAWNSAFQRAPRAPLMEARR
jgi:hypothetical protein